MSNQNSTCTCKPFFGCVCNQEVPAKVIEIINAFGGIHNINAFSNSVSELRYDVKDLTKVSSQNLKALGASRVEVFEATKHIQADFGTVTEELNFEIRKYAQILVKQEPKDTNTRGKLNNAQSSIKTANLEHLNVLAPVSGEILPLTSLNDGIFSEGLVGAGLVIKLKENSGKLKLVAPFDGKITMLPASKNQFLFTNSHGVELVIVIGLDSYKLNGIGINLLAQVNSEVAAGQNLFELDLDQFANEKIDTRIIICASYSSSLTKIANQATEAKTGSSLFDLV